MSETDREFCTRAAASLKRALPVDDRPDITLSHQDSPVLTDLQNGLLVAYLVDQEERFHYVQYRHLAAAVTEAELERLGIANLATILGQKGADVRPYQNIFAVFFDGNFEASLILLDDLWNEELAHFVPNGLFIAAVPCRDILAFCDAENASGIQELRQAIQRAEKGDHPISSVLYRRHGSIWTPYAD